MPARDFVTGRAVQNIVTDVLTDSNVRREAVIGHASSAATFARRSAVRIVELDGVRGLAVLMIVELHYVGRWNGVPHSASYYLKKCLALNWSGVDLFFVLSGFLIGRILLENTQSQNYFRTFYVRRACRIFPLYYAALALFALMYYRFGHEDRFAWLFPDARPWWPYVTYTNNFVPTAGTQSRCLAVTWTLANEEQFYLLIPLLIRYVSKRWLPLVLFSLIIIAPLLRTVAPSQFQLILWRSDSLVSGVLLALLVWNEAFLALCERYRSQLLALFALLCAGYVAMTVEWQHQETVFSHCWLAMLFAVTILLIKLDYKPLTAIFRNRALVFLGGISYFVYLMHMAVLGVVFAVVRQGAPRVATVGDWLLLVAAFGATILMAVLSYRFFEKPILGWGRSFKY